MLFLGSFWRFWALLGTFWLFLLFWTLFALLLRKMANPVSLVPFFFLSVFSLFCSLSLSLRDLKLSLRRLIPALTHLYRSHFLRLASFTHFYFPVCNVFSFSESWLQLCKFLALLVSLNCLKVISFPLVQFNFV